MLPIINWSLLILICTLNFPVELLGNENDEIRLKEVSARPSNLVFLQEIVNITQDGKVVSSTGNISIKKNDQDGHVELSTGDEIKEGTVLGLSPNSSVLIKFGVKKVSLYSDENTRWFVFQKKWFIR